MDKYQDIKETLIISCALNIDTNVELLEKILVNNNGSSAFFIKKAIGWNLRDYS